MLREEARLIDEKLGETLFKGTNGWLAKWKQRHSVAQMSVASEEGDVSRNTQRLGGDEGRSYNCYKCFKHVGMYPNEAEAIEIDDPFPGVEELEMETLLSKVSTLGQDLDMSSFDDDVDTYDPPIDTSSPNWREFAL